MIDRKKVIRSLNNTLRHCHNLYNHVTNEEQIWLAEINQGAKDALALLKEQKALPIVYQNNEYTGLPMARCPSCGEYLVQFHSGVDGKESRFCYYCGQEVKWNG